MASSIDAKQKSLDHYANVFSRFSSVPLVKQASLLVIDRSSTYTNYILESQWDQLDTCRKDTIAFTRNHTFTVGHEKHSIQLICCSKPVFVSYGEGLPFPKQHGVRTIWSIVSPTGRLRAVCLDYAHQVTSSSDKTCSPEVGTFVHLWCGQQLLKTIRLPSVGQKALHGKVYPCHGSVFFGISWSQDDANIIYVAEAICTRISQLDEGQTPAASPFFYDDNWGEALSESRQSVLCLLDLRTEKVTVLVDNTILPSVCPSEPIWSPEYEGIVFVGYSVRSFRLGLVYCCQRPTGLYYFNLTTKECTLISSETSASRCPRFSPDGKHLVWLENPVGGPHGQCQSLVACNWPLSMKDSPTVVVHPVDKPHEVNGFPGIYGRLPIRCWTPDSRCVVFSSAWGFKVIPLVVEVIDRSGTYCSDGVFPLNSLPSLDDAANGGSSTLSHSAITVNVLDFHENILVCAVSSVDCLPFLAACLLPLPIDPTSSVNVQNSSWLCIPSNSSGAPNLLKGIKHTILSHGVDSYERFESLLVWPEIDKYGRPAEVIDVPIPCPELSSIWQSLPKSIQVHGLIVWPHGGPHTAFSVDWSAPLASFVSSGFACLLVNYRGSLGYGESNVNSLIGRIGQADVEDNVQATQEALHYLKSAGLTQKIPTVLYGGSHGGFLVLFLAARHPNLYRAIVARNPVTHLVSMIDTSDIPDWCYTEAGITPKDLWPFTRIPDVSDLAKLSTASPLTHLTPGWSTPLLLALGAGDRRVPISQGLTFYRKCRAICPNVPCEVLLYPHDSHPLDSPATRLDLFIRTLDWFRRHTYPTELDCVKDD